MKLKVIILVVVALITIGVLGFKAGHTDDADQSNKVVFHDSEFEETIRLFIDKPEGDILPSNLDQLSIMVIPPGVFDITGIEYCKNLETLFLRSSEIDDYMPLATLPKLAFLAVKGNHITDISPFAELKNIEFLDLRNNAIIDLSPLLIDESREPELTVYLTGNPLDDISINGYIAQLEEKGIHISWNGAQKSLSGLVELSE